MIVRGCRLANGVVYSAQKLTRYHLSSKLDWKECLSWEVRVETSFADIDLLTRCHNLAVLL